MDMGVQIPWDGLGTDINKSAGVKAALKKAKLDWTVERRALQLNDGGGDIKDFSALVRDSDDKVFDIVGSRYTPVQNEQAFTFFMEFVEAGGAKMETIGSFGGGKIVWGMANLNAGFELKGGDKVGGYLLCVCPHEQGKSLVFKTTTVRVWCMNTLAMALRQKNQTEWRMTHRTAFEGVKVAEAKVALGIARDQIGEFEKNAKLLQKLKVSKEEFIELIAPVYGNDKENDNKRMQQLIDAYENAPGAQPGNGWGAINAVTYYADHMASRTPDKRMTNAWLGRTSIQKELILERLLERV
jgi:phage/plasmid-like protein (TIGR03299 family)